MVLCGDSLGNDPAPDQQEDSKDNEREGDSIEQSRRGARADGAEGDLRAGVEGSIPP